MTIDAECLVVGAGVIGLACARTLQQRGIATFLLERNGAIGQETSARNSEVIHSGIYYPPGSAKARFCVEGRRALHDYCAAKGVAQRRLGKIVVATDASEDATLRDYLLRAEVNGVAADGSEAERLRMLDPVEVASLEPALRVHSALWVPQTGIVDGGALMRSLLQDFEVAGGQLVLNTPVRGGWIEPDRLEVELDDAQGTRVRSRRLVNATGPWAPALARSLIGFPQHHVPSAYFAAGHYFALKGPSPFTHLVYPVAVKGGLGIHVTLDMAGAARFGPDVDWRPQFDLAFDASRAPAFERAIRRYYPGLPDGALLPGYTGIRPKINGPDDPAADFLVQAHDQHGIAGLVHLFGIESPGLTASLAIARHVAELLG